MTRAEMFAKANEDAKKKEAERQERKNNGGFSKDFEDIPFVALETDKVKVLRLVGDPYTIRSKPTDSKIVLSSWMVDDKNQNFVCKWSEDKKWILWRIFDKVMESKWDKTATDPNDPTKKGMRVYLNATKYPELYKRVKTNGRDASKYERGWYPTRSIVINAIDRDDYEWHTTNKACKVLAKKVKESENDKGEITRFYEPGIPVSCYDLILKSVVEENGVWEDFDIAIRKTEGDPYYEVYSSMDERKIKEAHAKMSGEPLNADEMSWKLNDLDHLYQITSYRKIQSRLGDFIAEVDRCLQTKFVEELSSLVEEEKAKYAAQKAEAADATATGDTKPAETKPETAKESAPVERKARTPASVGDTPFSLMRNAGWKAVDEFEERFKENIQAINIGKNDADTAITFVIDGDVVPVSAMLDCPDCHLLNDSSVDFCPRCGARF